MQLELIECINCGEICTVVDCPECKQQVQQCRMVQPQGELQDICPDCSTMLALRWMD